MAEKWRRVGFARISRSGKVLVLTVGEAHSIIDLADLEALLEGKRPDVSIFCSV